MNAEEERETEKLFLAARVALAALSEMLGGMRMYAVEPGAPYVDVEQLRAMLVAVQAQWRDAQRRAAVGR